MIIIIIIIIIIMVQFINCYSLLNLALEHKSYLDRYFGVLYAVRVSKFTTRTRNGTSAECLSQGGPNPLAVLVRGTESAGGPDPL